jgi:hypothetical protein
MLHGTVKWFYVQTKLIFQKKCGKSAENSLIYLLKRINWQFLRPAHRVAHELMRFHFPPHMTSLTLVLLIQTFVAVGQLVLENNRSNLTEMKEADNRDAVVFDLPPKKSGPCCVVS